MQCNAPVNGELMKALAIVYRTFSSTGRPSLRIVHQESFFSKDPIVIG